MPPHPNNKVGFSLQLKFLLCITLIVFPLLGVIFVWNGVRAERTAKDQVLNQARVLARQIVLTRQWISDCGGIMVSKDSDGARNTAYFFNDPMETTRGTYQRFTPSMVTKKLSEYSLRENLYRFRLASIHPLNPANEPNAFERQAIFDFIHNGAEEVYVFNDQGRSAAFHYSIPLYADKACMRCHQEEQYTMGSIVGCLSIIFPSETLAAILRTDHLQMAGAGVGLVLLTTFTLFFLLRRLVINPVNRLKDMAGQISDGNLAARVHIDSADEFAQLGQVFNTMGERLAANHEMMAVEVAQATRELSQANRDLKDMDRIKTEFFADMSHELRSPITAINGAVEYLQRTIGDPDKKGYVEIIEKNCMRMFNMVSDLFDLTKIEAGKVVWSFEEVDIAELIGEVTEILSLQAKEHGVHICMEETSSIPVEIDPERMEQVMVNLIENAIKFSPRDSGIKIQTRLDDDEVEVSVRDQGEGISPQDLENIFRKFHTLPSSGGEGRPTGTGLGLTICKKIVEAHGGRIWAESGPGRGSVFFIRLPRRHPEASGAAKADASA